MDRAAKLEQDIKKFLEVYKILSPSLKAQFEAQMAGAIKDIDDKTKRLYRALLLAAQDGCDLNEAIERMKKASL
jgi:hypothetical protein